MKILFSPLSAAITGLLFLTVLALSGCPTGGGTDDPPLPPSVKPDPALPIGGLRLHYLFNYSDGKIIDETGNGYDGIFDGDASYKRVGDYGFLSLDGGVVDMGEKTGELVSTLANFTMGVYVYVYTASPIGEGGNFILSFAKGSNQGNLFFSAGRQSYEITKTSWSSAQATATVGSLSKGSWKHILYQQKGNTGSVYANGKLLKTGTISILPKDLGKTPYNYLAKSPYGDAVLQGALLCDLRIYDRALSGDEISLFADTNKLDNLNTAINTALINEYIAALDPGNLGNVVADLVLPTAGTNAITVSWLSSAPDYLSNTGKLQKRPSLGAPAKTVELTATFIKGKDLIDKTYTVTIPADLTDTNSVQEDKANLDLKGRLDNLRSDLTLPVTGTEHSVITWSSSNTARLGNDGKVTLNTHGNGKVNVTLTATITKGSTHDTKAFTISIGEDEGYAGYLFAYFTGNAQADEQLHFAVSDGATPFTFKALNGNKSVIPSASISEMGGIRDPHLIRGEDGKFYMVLTDMASSKGWTSNRGIILAKSDNLLDWTHSKINFRNVFGPLDSRFNTVNRAWAPQTIWDPAAGKYMVYLTIANQQWDDNINDGQLLLTFYYAYANSDFTALEGVPQQFYNIQAIDADICPFNGKYYLFHKTENAGNNIAMTVSDTITGPYKMVNNNVDKTGSAVEGCGTYRLYNTDTYVLMYDVYNGGWYEFTTTEDFETFTVVESSLDFHPRHGSIIPITAEELAALRNKTW
ncbi:hypothetical protein AGMMS4952_16500 [Spirochaetia bacterium]|nr:hypothetical protein AGMMS4952_16500 [Spirochaetia bacterium]